MHNDGLSKSAAKVVLFTNADDRNNQSELTKN